MSNLIGRVRFNASIDGRDTPRQAEKTGRDAGKAGAEGFDKEFSRTFRDTLSKQGRRSFDAWTAAGRKDGATYATGLKTRLDAFMRDAQRNFQNLRLDPGFLDDFAKGFDNADEAAGRLRGQLETLRNETGLNKNSYDSARRQIDEWANAKRRAAAESERLAQRTATETALNERLDDVMRRNQAVMAERIRARRQYADLLESQVNRMRLENESLDRQVDSFGRLRRSIDRVSNSTMDLSFRWRDLSHNTRQWTLIIGAILAAMEDLAVLGSAAGAGLVALGGAASSGLIGVGGLAAVIVTLNKDLDELPPSLRAVASEGKEFTQVFIDMREVIAGGAFDQMRGVFPGLERSVRSLTPQFELLGRSVGNVFRDLEQNVRPGTEALEQIRQQLRLAGPNFEALASTAGTFGVAFLRSFNRAQPLVEDLLGWLDLLAVRFDRFTQSNGFDMWMSNAEVTFGRLGPLLDSLGRLLNDLVNPASVARTADFIQNLTDFMPDLTRFLDILGRLDIFNAIALALENLGRGLRPLSGPAADLADALARLVAIQLDAFGTQLSAVSSALAPFVQVLANFLNSIPEPVLYGIANGLLAVAAAFVVLKGARGVAGIATALSTASTALYGWGTVASGASRALGTLAARLPQVAALAAGVTLASTALVEYGRDLRGIDDAVARATTTNQGLVDSFDALGVTAAGSADGIIRALDAIGSGNVLGTVGLDIMTLRDGLTYLQEGFETLPLEDAVAKFQAWGDELGLSRAQMQTLLSELPTLEEQIRLHLTTTGEAATQQDVLAFALKQTVPAVEDNVQALADLQGKAYDGGEAIDSLAEKIRGFGSATLNARDAEREFEQAVDDLTEAVGLNGATLDITTQAGRDNEKAIDDLVTSTLEFAAAAVEQTGKQESANEVIAKGREQLVKMMTQFGLTEDEANSYADELGLIPENVSTAITLSGFDAAVLWAQRVRDTINSIPSSKTVSIGIRGQGGVEAMASGGVLTGPRHILAGEAGSEAIVPLDRPLSLVDESVRWLSAIAQGQGTPTMAGGGIVTSGMGQVTFSERSIVVEGVDDADRAANEVLRRVIEKVNG